MTTGEVATRDLWGSLIDMIQKMLENWGWTDNPKPPDEPTEPPDEPTEPPDTPDEHDASKEYSFDAIPKGEVSLDTAGIRHTNKKADDGGWEHIFLTLYGPGFNRLMLFHAGGPGRKIRYYIEHTDKESAVHRMEVADDNLPDWHNWTICWGDGKMSFYLDGKKIGRTEEFLGSPDRAIAGGYADSSRNFKGRWRNFQFKKL